MLMSVLNSLTDAAAKQTAQTLRDHITVSVTLDTREMGKIVQVLISYIFKWCLHPFTHNSKMPPMLPVLVASIKNRNDPYMFEMLW